MHFNSDTFTFTNTGERVPFEELATLTDSGKEVKVPLKKAEEIDDLTHNSNVKQIFDPKPKLSRSDLLTRLSRIYGKNFGTAFSEDRCKKYLDYLQNDLGVITKYGKDRSPTAYYSFTSGCELNTTE